MKLLLIAVILSVLAGCDMYGQRSTSPSSDQQSQAPMPGGGGGGGGY